MDNFQPSSGNLFNVVVDIRSRQYLHNAASWARIIAILSFISSGFALITVFTDRNDEYKIVTLIMSLIVIAISVTVNIFLLRFGTNTLSSLQNMNQEKFNTGINGLHSYFKVIGIIMIICLSAVVLMILFAIIGLGLR
ncbi:MAG TPA: hypothetical protein VM012_01310 [Flavitalea sp.]|nr:hypothetical protein [Flavitalea sp.]